MMHFNSNKGPVQLIFWNRLLQDVLSDQDLATTIEFMKAHNIKIRDCFVDLFINIIARTITEIACNAF